MNTYVVYQHPDGTYPIVLHDPGTQELRSVMCKVLHGYVVLARDKQHAINTFNFIVAQVNNSRHIKE